MRHSHDLAFRLTAGIGCAVALAAMLAPDAMAAAREYPKHVHHRTREAKWNRLNSTGSGPIPLSGTPAETAAQPGSMTSDAAAPQAETKTTAAEADAPQDTLAPGATDLGFVPSRRTVDVQEDRLATYVEAELGRREAARISAGRYEVAVMAGIGMARRDFTFSDPLGDQPQPYRLAATPMANASIDVYPLAGTALTVLRDLGVQGYFGRAFAVASATTTGAALGTHWTRFGGDLRQRFLFPRWHAFDAGVTVGFHASYFDLRSMNNVGALLPSSRMLSLRFGVDARALVAWRLSLIVGGGYLAPLSHGEIYDHFRDPQVEGLEGQVGAALGLTPGVELRLDTQYTRYFSRFNPRVGDAIVAGGALDQQFQVGLGIRYAH